MVPLLDRTQINYHFCSKDSSRSKLGSGFDFLYLGITLCAPPTVLRSRATGPLKLVQTNFFLTYI